MIVRPPYESSFTSWSQSNCRSSSLRRWKHDPDKALDRFADLSPVLFHSTKRWNGLLSFSGPLVLVVISSPMANLRTTILDLRGFDSSIILILRGEILMSIGNITEMLS